jgi:hypothetical protein
MTNSFKLFSACLLFLFVMGNYLFVKLTERPIIIITFIDVT